MVQFQQQLDQQVVNYVQLEVEQIMKEHNVNYVPLDWLLLMEVDAFFVHGMEQQQV